MNGINDARVRLAVGMYHDKSMALIKEYVTYLHDEGVGNSKIAELLNISLTKVLDAIGLRDEK